MLRNVTLSAEEKLIDAARNRARSERTTLNNVFREWLARYTKSGSKAREYAAVMYSLKHVSSKRRFTREEMNER